MSAVESLRGYIVKLVLNKFLHQGSVVNIRPPYLRAAKLRYTTVHFDNSLAKKQSQVKEIYRI